MGLCTSLIVAAAALEGEEKKTLQEWCAAGCLWEEEKKIISLPIATSSDF